MGAHHSAFPEIIYSSLIPTLSPLPPFFLSDNGSLGEVFGVVLYSCAPHAWNQFPNWLMPAS